MDLPMEHLEWSDLPAMERWQMLVGAAALTHAYFTVEGFPIVDFKEHGRRLFILYPRYNAPGVRLRTGTWADVTHHIWGLLTPEERRAALPFPHVTVD